MWRNLMIWKRYCWVFETKILLPNVQTQSNNFGTRFLWTPKVRIYNLVNIFAQGTFTIKPSDSRKYWEMSVLWVKNAVVISVLLKCNLAYFPEVNVLGTTVKPKFIRQTSQGKTFFFSKLFQNSKSWAQSNVYSSIFIQMKSPRILPCWSMLSLQYPLRALTRTLTRFKMDWVAALSRIRTRQFVPQWVTHNYNSTTNSSAAKERSSRARSRTENANLSVQGQAGQNTVRFQTLWMR